jgi:hypothetical protein
MPTSLSTVFLGSGGTLPPSSLPPEATIEYQIAADEAEMTALTAQRGDIAIRTDLDDAWFALTADDATIASNWQERARPLGLGEVLIQGWIRGDAPSSTSDGDIWFEKIGAETFMVINDSGTEKAVELSTLAR